jgi:carbohydrate kinase (thermoresistant glucokinase family)
VSAFVVMGVSGCGKSSVAQSLAERVGGVFLDADDFHPRANKDRMAAGIPLTDDDRWSWLDILNAELRRRGAETVFLACSALRQVYRDRLAAGLPDLKIIYLQGSKELIGGRLRARAGHFMPPALLDSQFATLEEPADVITVSIEPTLPEVVETIMARLAESPAPQGNGE